MVRVLSEKIPEEVEVDQDAPQASDEEKENPQEDSIEKTPELSDDVVAQEPQVKESDDESTPIISGLPASSSAINETELQKTDTSSSRKGKETCEIKTGDKEDDSNDDDDDFNVRYEDYEEYQYEYRDEISSLITQPEVMVLPQQNLGLGSLDPQSSHQISRSDPMVNQQQQFTTLNQPFVMQQPLPIMIRPFMPYGFGPLMAAPWIPPIIIPFMPNHTIIPMMQPPMMYQNVQMRPGINQQTHIVPYLWPDQAPMMPVMCQHVQMRPGANQVYQIVPNLLMRPGTNQQNHSVPYLAPGQAPMMYQHVQMRPGANQQSQGFRGGTSSQRGSRRRRSQD